MVWIVLIQSIHASGAHAHKKKDTTPKRNGLFKILRKEHAQLRPSLLHQNYLLNHHGNSIAHVCHCVRMSRLTELSLITIYSYEWLTISSICWFLSFVEWMASSNVLTLTKAKQQILLIMSPLFVTHARYHSNFMFVKNPVHWNGDLSGTEKKKQVF